MIVLYYVLYARDVCVLIVLRQAGSKRTVVRPTLGWVIARYFYPGSSVGSTITFGIVEDTSSNPTSNISFKRNACECVLL